MSPPVWSARAPVLLGVLTIILLLAGTIGWGMMSTIGGAIVAQGQIEVARQRQIVQHADGGIIASIEVAEGDHVAAGQILMRLDRTQPRSELAIVRNQLHEILARRGRLEAERDGASAPAFPPQLMQAATRDPVPAELMEGQRRLFDDRQDSLARQIEQLGLRRAQTEMLIQGIDARIAAFARQRELIARELVDQQSLLDKGLAQAARVLSLQREEARLLGEEGELIGSRAEAMERITETRLEVLRLQSARREEASTQLRDIAWREPELAERARALDERIARLDIRAPVSGVVLGLQVTTPQAVIRPADPLLHIIPQDRPLVIAVRVANLHIDEVRPGQPVKVVLSAFSSRTTPELQGHVALVAPDVQIDPVSHAPYYRAEIALPPDQIARLGKLVLIPGMPVEVFIATGERTPVQFLVKPFTDYLNRAFRES